MEEATIKLHAQILAIEYFLAEAFRMIYGLARFSQEEIEASHRELRDVLRTLRVPSDDPAISDLIAAELEEAHTRLLGMIRVAGEDR
jgi:hypothetical protein